MATRSADAARINYLSTFEKIVVTLVPALAGRIDWDTALHYFHQRTEVHFAAARYVANRGGNYVGV